MDKIKLNIYPALSGDAFLIEFSNKKNFIIDMGFNETYKNYIKSDLETIKSRNQVIDLLVITHIDEDHIDGAIEFLKENKDSRRPKVVDIMEVWHNSYRHLQLNKSIENRISSVEKSIFDEIRKRDNSRPKNKVNEVKEISAEQGSTLASYIYGYNYNWNSLFEYNAICVENKSDVHIDGVYIELISPNEKKLKSLSRKWISFLNSKKFDFRLTDEQVFDDAYEFYIRSLCDFDVNEFSEISKTNVKFDIEKLKNEKANKSDYSASNGSSISFRCSYENKHMLFLGDCHENILQEYLLSLKEKDINEGPLYFDVIKIPHHGSIRNNSKWINLVRAKYYIFSTDSKSHPEHPSIGVVCNIISMNKNSDDKIHLVFNYKVDLIKFIDNPTLKKIYNYDIIYQENKKTVIKL